MEHALALTLQQITGSQQDTACTHQNICHPVGSTGLDQLAALRAGILYRRVHGGLARQKQKQANRTVLLVLLAILAVGLLIRGFTMNWQ